MHTLSFLVAVLYTAAAVVASNIVVTVGAPGAVFQPQRVAAALGDTIIFNFTAGNHTATQSEFATPCSPAHDTNITVNGFNSGFRATGNGTGPSILTVPLLPQNFNQIMWFFDYNTCGQGGVGVINSNESSTETLAGFVNNAERLNGTSSSSSASSTGSGTSTSSTTTSSGSAKPSSAADRAVYLGALGVLPLLSAIAVF